MFITRRSIRTLASLAFVNEHEKYFTYDCARVFKNRGIR